MKKQLFALAALAMVLVGCKKEIDPPEPDIPQSEFLVVKAECIPLSKTSYNEGETTWVKGDVIELIYKGELYTYTASDSGNSVYFSSDNGIADYDGSEIVAYYNAFIAEENLVGIEASKTVTYEGEDFVSPAHAPMIGSPIEAKTDKGVVTIGFHNVFSTLEVFIDPTGKESDSPIKSFTLEPAANAVFDGYLSFNGTIDPETRALTATENGTSNKIEVNLPVTVDQTKTQTIQLPVGRFTSSTGLKLTINLEDGDTYVRTLFPDGVATFEEVEGVFNAKHLARASVNFVPTFFSGGNGTERNPYAIATKEDLQELATYVASKDSEFLPFRTAHYVQTADIDFEGGTHNSIGNTNDAAPFSFFCGKYDGKGYKIKNVVIANPNSNKAQGFFGYLDGDAHIKNMTFENASINSTTWNTGIIVGCVQSSTTLGLIENCVVTKSSVTGNNTDNGGLCGKLMGGKLLNCSFDGTVTATTSAKHQAGGIVGQVSNAGATIDGCTFNGTVKGACGNVGGIAGALNGGATIKNCTVTSTSVVEGGSISDNGINVGGIVGYVNNSATGGQVSNCICEGTIKSHYYDAGGIAGHNRGLAIIGCTFSGTINCDYDDSAEAFNSSGAGSTKYSRIGGICGDQRGSGNIDRCTVTGTINGKKWTGGIVGLVEASGVNNSVFSGKVTGTNTAAGIAAYVATGSVKSCSVNNATVNGEQNVGGIVGSTTATGYVTSCNVAGSTIKATSLNVGGIAGHFNKGGLVSQCNVENSTIETNHKLAGGIVGNIADCTNAQTARIENCNVYGGTVTATANGIAGGIFGGANGYGIVNKCSANCNVANTGTGGGCVGGIGGWVSSNNLLVINCIYYGNELTNDNNTNGGVAGIVGSFAASSLANTAIVNCAAFPTKVSTGSSNANIAGIAGYANTVTINNCYCPTPASAFYFNGAASGSSRGSIYGWLRGNNGATGSSGTIVNVYWIDGFKAGASSGSFSYTKKEQSLTDAQMKNNGAVSMPSTGTAYSCFIDALNAGADEYNKAMIFDVRAEEWVMGTNGYPVVFGCPIASSTATSSKKRVSLLGDSITTYKGYTLFPSNGQYPNSNYSDFTSVTQTYWYQLIYNKMTNAVLEANSSHTATCVQNTVKNGYPGYGFLNRYADLGNPDVIFINGGTNDSWSFKLPVGTLDFSIATNDLDTYQFAQAYDKLIRLMKEKYPKAKIFCIIGDCVMDIQYKEYAQVIRDVCNHYNVKYAEVKFANRSASTYDNVHPNVAGMKEMADQIWEQVKSHI